MHGCFQGNLRRGNLELEDMLVFDLSTRPLTTSLYFGPSLRRHDITLRTSVSTCGFWKAFDFVPCEVLFQRLRDIGVLDTLLTTIMCLNDSVLGHLCVDHGTVKFFQEYHWG